MANSILSNLLSFNKMVSEQIIKLVYYVGLLLIALGLVKTLIGAFSAGVIGFLPAVLMGIIGTALAVLLWRVFCESIIIMFRMYARLGDINTTLGGKNVEAAIPGDEALKAAREAALNTKNAALEKAGELKSKLKRDDDAIEVEAPQEVKPAAAPPKRPAAKKTTAKKPTTKKKTPPKK